MRQFFLDISADELPEAGSTVALAEDESHHLFTVLRGGRESTLHLVDGRGHRLTGVAAGKDGKRALVKIASVLEDPTETSRPLLVLCCAVVKGKRFEWALEKAVELGAHHIVPLRCEHGVIDPRPGKHDRWLNVMKSAVKQCGRSWLPGLAEPQTVAEALSAGAGAERFFGAAPGESPGGEAPSWTGLLAERPEPLPESLVLFVGPEGGWTPGELASLGGGARPLSLGPHILRAETAVAAGITALQTVRQIWLGETRST